MTRYISPESVVAINARLCGRVGGLRDRTILEGQLGRPMSGVSEQEFYPTLWDKAAVLLHGHRKHSGL